MLQHKDTTIQTIYRQYNQIRDSDDKNNWQNRTLKQTKAITTILIIFKCRIY
jgi:hypothetical protein